jgi:hypothetical protein
MRYSKLPIRRRESKFVALNFGVNFKILWKISKLVRNKLKLIANFTLLDSGLFFSSNLFSVDSWVESSTIC